MFIYNLIFIIPFLIFYLTIKINISNKDQQKILFLFLFLLNLLIGFRRFVGGDWIPYSLQFEQAKTMYYESFFNKLEGSYEPFYIPIAWVLSNSNLNITSINLVYSSIFCFGLYKLCRAHKYTFFPLVVAFPYLILVVAMGYTRQSAAIGIFMYLLSKKAKIVKISFFSFIALQLHNSGIIVFAFSIFDLIIKKVNKKNIIYSFLLLAIIVFFLKGTISRYYLHYVLDGHYVSGGFYFRQLTQIVPLCLFLMFYKYLKEFPIIDNSKNILILVAIFSIFSLPFVIFFPDFIPAFDRMSLYFYPFQIIILSNIFLIPKNKKIQTLISFLIFLYCLTILNMWLMFSTHNIYWVPYTF